MMWTMQTNNNINTPGCILFAAAAAASQWSATVTGLYTANYWLSDRQIIDWLIGWLIQKRGFKTYYYVYVNVNRIDMRCVYIDA